MTDAERARMLELELELGGDEHAKPAPPPPAPGYGASALAGVQQLGTFGWGDELGAAIQGGLAKAAGTGDYGETYRQARGENRAETKAAKEAHPGAYYAAGLPAAIAAGAAMPALKAGQGASLLVRALYGAGSGVLPGAIAGAGESQADTLGGVAKDAGVGGLLGAGAGVAGAGLGALGQRAVRGAASIDEAVARKAAQEAAAETGSLRSAAGTTAQDTYKQLEHLRETGAINSLSPEEAQVADRLTKELGGKAAAKLLPSAARKEAAAAAYAEGMATEGERAAEKAASRYGLKAAKAQIVPRLIRYGLPALGGALGLGGHGGMAGAGVGALAGAGLRPMMHSLLRAAKDPSIAGPALSAAGSVLGRLGPVVESGAGTEAQALAPATSEAISPYVQALVDALRKKGEPGEVAQRGEP